MTSKSLWVALIAVAIIAAGGYVFPHVAATLGGLVNYDEVDATAIKVGGSSGSRIGPVISSTCTIIGGTASQIATTSIPYDCAITGIVSGDNVIGQVASSSAGASQGSNWAIGSSLASTTAGFATFMVTNNTGAARPPMSLVVTYLVTHPRTAVPGL